MAIVISLYVQLLYTPKDLPLNPGLDFRCKGENKLSQERTTRLGCFKEFHTIVLDS